MRAAATADLTRSASVPVEVRSSTGTDAPSKQSQQNSPIISRAKDVIRSGPAGRGPILSRQTRTRTKDVVQFVRSESQNLNHIPYSNLDCTI